jgi:hypothetical protein
MWDHCQQSAIPFPRRGSPFEQSAPTNNTEDQSRRSFTITESENDLDLGEVSQDAIGNDYDPSVVYGADRTQEDLDTVVVPTLYSNSYTGSASVNLKAAEKEAKLLQQDRYTTLNTSLPRDHETGKIDVRPPSD